MPCRRGRMMRWPLALAGLWLAIFTVAALTGPGRIDIEDGQARYESGRNLILHGDPGIRDPRIVWHRYPGRDGIDFSYYRLCGELLAAAAAGAGLLLKATECQSHFIFSLQYAAVRCCNAWDRGVKRNEPQVRKHVEANDVARHRSPRGKMPAPRGSTR